MNTSDPGTKDESARDETAGLDAGACKVSSGDTNTYRPGQTHPTPIEPVVPNSSPARTRIARFDLIREIGRGGHGIVYLALDPILGRYVAIKIPRPELLCSKEFQSRFLLEARAAAVLNHPNILKVFEAGSAGDTCYIATEYCNGPSLSHWLRSQSGPVDLRTVATIVAELSDGVQEAHNQGILHRDLKPDNVLLEQLGPGEASQVAGLSGSDPSSAAVLPGASYRPKLADFGIAKVFDEDTGLTSTGTVLGTASYMPPEQAAGHTKEIGPAADVYGLGAILYELLTRRAPFKSESYVETMRQVANDLPAPPRSIRPDVSRDLEAICRKCLEKAPGDRYASAAALASDLRRFLE